MHGFATKSSDFRKRETCQKLEGLWDCVGQNIVPHDSYGSTLLVSFWCIQCLYSEGQTILFVQIIQINENLGGWQGIIAFWRLNLPKLGEGWQFCDMIFIIDDLYIFYILLYTFMYADAFQKCHGQCQPSCFAKWIQVFCAKWVSWCTLHSWSTLPGPLTVRGRNFPSWCLLKYSPGAWDLSLYQSSQKKIEASTVSTASVSKDFKEI